MTFYFYCILAALVLLASYATLLIIEARRGTRVFAPVRVRLDRAVEQAHFIAEHVDFASFFRAEAKRLALYLSHESAHLALQGVRAVERFLTHIVKRLRLHPEAPVPEGASTRHFVRTLSEFKGHLDTTRPEVAKIR